MKRPALLLGLALLLASCGGGVTPPPSGALNVNVDTTLTSGLNAPATLRLNGTATSNVTVSVTSAPAGLTVTAGTPSPSGSDTILPVTASGNASGVVQLSVSAAGKTASVSLPVTGFKVYDIQPSGAVSSSYQVSAIRAQTDGTLLLRAPASGDEQQRHSLVKFDPASGQASFLNYPLTGLETITSHTVGADGRVWVTVRGVTAEGSRLIAMNGSGQTERFLANSTDTLIGLTSTSDGRIWYTQFTNDKIVSLNPKDGTLTPTAVDDNIEGLTLGFDGKLYHTRYYANPAIIQRDPQTGASQVFNVGTPNQSLPIALTPAHNGTLWFIEARTGSVWNLDPASGQQTQVTLPVGARPTELAAAPDGTLWVADPSAGNLYRVASGQRSSTTIPALKTASGTTNGLRGLAVTNDGKLWYESNGKLVTTD